MGELDDVGIRFGGSHARNGSGIDMQRNPVWAVNR